MFKTINGGTQLPTRGSKYSACVDLYAREDIIIGVGETKLIPLGVCIDDKEIIRICDNNYKYGYDAFKDSHYLQLMLRSSLSKELIIANGVGVIDLDYKDEIMIRVHRPISSSNPIGSKVINLGGYSEIKKGDRVAQITMLEHKGYLMNIHSKEERDGGFGSTGKA